MGIKPLTSVMPAGCSNDTPYFKMAANKFSFVCMLISPLRLVNMNKKAKEF